MSIVSEIKKLIREKGGTPSGDTIAALLDDFLSANGGGGGGLFVVTVTSDGNGGYTADKTYAEIKAAYEAGQICQARMEDTVGWHYYRLGRMGDAVCEFGPEITGAAADNSGLFVRCEMIDLGDGIEVSLNQLKIRAEMST